MRVNYFGEIAEVTNKLSEDVVLKNTSLSELILFMESKYKLHLEDIHIAVNHDIVSTYENIDLKETDEVAVLSPFAGG